MFERERVTDEPESRDRRQNHHDRQRSEQSRRGQQGDQPQQRQPENARPGPGRRDPQGQYGTEQGQGGTQQGYQRQQAGGQPPGGQSPGGQPPGGQPPHGGESAGGSDDTTRRNLLLGAGGALAIVGGWYVFLREDRGPLDVIEDLWEAWESGDRERFQELFHSRSPVREESWWTDTEYWMDFDEHSEGVDWSLEQREVVRESESAAEVEEVYTWRDYENDYHRRITDLYELRTDDDEWKVWEIETVDSEEI